MTFLLDTHVALWLMGQPASVPEVHRATLADPANTLAVSPVSAFEVATKVRLGRLRMPGFTESWSRLVVEIGAERIDLDEPSALLAGRLEWAHRDPFDRLLVAQSITSGATLVTVDTAIRAFPLPRVLTW